jgi:hypothetical protein
VSQTTSGAEVTLSRELADCLIEFSVALHKHAIYPDGHPLLEQAVTAMTQRVGAVLIERPMLAFGVARQQLVVEGVSTDPNSPVLRDLALRLYKREIGAVKFLKGVEEDEIAEMLRVVGREGARTIEGRVESAPEQHRHWPHVRLYPLTYDQLELLDDELQNETETTWATQLWLGLARAAMASDGEEPTAPVSSDPLVVAKAIESRARDVSYDRTIASYLSHVAGEIRAKGGPEAQALQRRVSQMVGALSQDTVARLLDMGGDVAERRRFVLDASHAMAVESVIDLVETTAAMEGKAISDSLLSLLSKLARHAEVGGASRGKADAALRENVRQLVTGWDAGNAVLPEHFAPTLKKLAHDVAAAAPPSTHPCEPERIVQLSLETAVYGVSTGRAITRLVEDGKVAPLLAMVDASPESNEVVQAIWERLDTADAIRAVLRQDPIDFDVLYRLVARVHTEALDPLIDALGDAKERNVRWKLFELIAQFGSDIGPAVVARMPTAPWYVQRNLLLLLQRLSDLPPDFAPEPYARHSDVRVRREALKLLVRVPHGRDKAIVDALNDEDERIVRFGLTAAIEGCPPAAIPGIIRRVESRELDPQLRVIAVRALAGARTTAALDCLLRAALAKRRFFFSRKRLASKSPLVLAALSVLSVTWSNDQRAHVVLAMARAHADQDIRGAATAQTVQPTPRVSEPIEALSGVDA